MVLHTILKKIINCATQHYLSCCETTLAELQSVLLMQKSSI